MCRTDNWHNCCLARGKTLYTSMNKLLPYCLSVCFTLCCALLLMTVALYAGYPLWMGDTHAYLSIGFGDGEAFDRSPFYGYFLRHSSLAETLWLTVLAQCLALSFLLLRYYRLLSGRDDVRGIIMFLLCTVGFTYVSWVMSCIQSDAFTPVVLLALALYVLDEGAGRGMQMAYVVLAFAGIMMHNSHFLIVCIVGALLLGYALVRGRRLLARKAAVMMSMGVAYYLLMCSVNAANGYGFVFSRASNLFLVTKLAETGILDQYLKDNCDKKQLKLCRYKEEITPFPWQFMYDGDSPYNKLGGYDSCKEEFAAISRDVLTTPKYLKAYMLRSATFTLRQMAELQEAGNIMPLPRDTWQTAGVRRHLPGDANEVIRSRQTLDQMNNMQVNVVNALFLLLSTLGVLLGERVVSRKVRRVYIFLLVFYVVNAFVTATASTVCSRYSFRIFWVLPATNAALLVSYALGRARPSGKEGVLYAAGTS